MCREIMPQDRLCTICARGGSKGVPGKNILSIAGKPLIAHSVEHALATRLFDVIAVSSDCDDILSAASKAGADIMIKRPKELASDTAGKHEVMLHALKEVEAMQGKHYSTYVDIDATSPLRLPEDIILCVKTLEARQCSNILTATPSRKSPYFNMIEPHNEKIKLSKDFGAFVRRQDVPATFDMNASIYTWNRDSFVQEPKNFYEDTMLVVMPETRAYDIDAPVDVAIVKALMHDGRYQEGDSYVYGL